MKNVEASICSTVAAPSAASAMPFLGYASVAGIGSQTQGLWLASARLRNTGGADAKHTPGDPPRELTGV